MSTYVETEAKDRKYFSSIRNYTLALLNSFNNVKFWVEQETEGEREYTIPISFGNYEKAQTLQDLDETQIKSGNYNYLPRLVLSFEGMSKAPERQTNKFQKLMKKIYDPETGRPTLDVSYNSLAYDFHFTLLAQTRGLTIASQVVEEVLIKFNPSLNLMIKEFPIFEDLTETQIKISDPAFEILDEFAEEEVNIMTVTFDITLRGNIYSPIEIKGPIETVKMFTHIWDEKDHEDSKLASYYRFDVSPDTHKVYRETARSFDGTLVNDEIVEEPEHVVIERRSDYHKYQSIHEMPENEYNTLDSIKEEDE